MNRNVRPHSPGTSASVDGAVKLVAFFEALKGILALLAASGLLTLLHKDLHDVALSLVEHAHLNPAAKYPQIFIAAASNLQDSRLVLLALGAAAYSGLRLVEALGLFLGRAWAELLAAFSGAIYLPFEFLEFVQHRTPLHVGLLLANAAVVALMVYELLQGRRRATQDAA